MAVIARGSLRAVTESGLSACFAFIFDLSIGTASCCTASRSDPSQGFNTSTSNEQRLATLDTRLDFAALPPGCCPISDQGKFVQAHLSSRKAGRSCAATIVSRECGGRGTGPAGVASQNGKPAPCCHFAPRPAHFFRPGLARQRMDCVRLGHCGPPASCRHQGCCYGIVAIHRSIIECGVRNHPSSPCVGTSYTPSPGKRCAPGKTCSSRAMSATCH